MYSHANHCFYLKKSNITTYDDNTAWHWTLLVSFPSATQNNTISRSVIMPTTFLPSQTGTDPQFTSRMILAAAVTGSFGVHTETFFVIMSCAMAC